MKTAWFVTTAILSATVLSGVSASAEEVVNVYTERHYQTDDALYANFTKETGIKVNLIEGKGAELVERIKSEGENSPADILVTVDAGNLWRADQDGIFKSVSSDELNARVPANLRHPDGNWYGFSTRARMIFFDKAKVKEGEVTSYEDLADPKWKGKVCIRESSNIYNQSLLASIVEHKGEAAAEEWAKAVVDNFAREPVKGDTNQLRGIGSGECEIAVANSYYFVRLQTTPEEQDKGIADKIGYVFPNQNDRGTHVNISGAGVVKTAPHSEAAVKFLEYLTSAEAQNYFADGNNEFPVVEGVAANAAVTALGEFKKDTVNVSVYGTNQVTAQKIFDRVGWK
ncbi:Fe(3+) ABC transporter substrate-binding protein [Kiloniella laminariae]|uniref:Fe(3+) ABC transporter substrate-binding protein n=1 Tax=Kiloniella laminariae TaxID=454162 RepID=A0ABT4LKQ0_9PROT|nr:Fe(3+) ABC transporter substrate-binding protein [Kiloniella laminariae]MCZ4280542.1 Fe(3+) ABC transporter substrate-binding protein [Kiloniella laminariae]